MEYLEIRGVVELSPKADKNLVRAILTKISKTSFCDEGEIEISLKQRCLSIQAEGTLTESSYTIKTLFRLLQPQLTELSVIGMSSVRWETLIVLRCITPVVELELLPLVASRF